MDTVTQVDFSDHATQSWPFDAYRELHVGHPVYRDPTTGFYVVLDYQLLRKVAADSKVFSNDTGVIGVRTDEIGEKMLEIQREHGVAQAKVLLITDPPEHTMYRSLVEKSFSPARVRKLQDYLTEMVEDLIDGFADKGEIEFVSEMSLMLPVYVVADFLGVDRSRAHDIKRWSDASAAMTDPGLSMEDIIAATYQRCEMGKFLIDQAVAYRQEPKECLLSDLANAEVNGHRLSDSELFSLVSQLVVAGHETTTNTMAGAMWWMINTPGLEQSLRADPARIPAFIEEVLRLEAPLQGMFRKTTQDVELGGVHIPAESVVVARWGGANRDPKVFENPDRLDIDRPNVRQHLAFGMGRHLCIGNQLARAELRIAFEQLLAKLCNFHLAGDGGEITRSQHYFIYGIRSMRVGFDRC